MIDKQKIELVKPYVCYGEVNERFFNFRALPHETATQLLSAWPNTEPKEHQNRSPSMKKLVDLATKYNGSLNGYCIPTESKREDARITFDGILLKIDKAEAMRLKRNLKPSEFSLLSDGNYRFWWD